ncbi:MAG: glycosyltransferase [Bacteroidaceae bacterium]|nr:glycosyltransferase [Bacteroidaceae bacterium]
MRILQLGKFYPLKGGVEKVMYALAKELSERGIDCDAMFASKDGHTQDIQLNEHCHIYICRTYLEAKATMIAPTMVTTLKQVCRHYDIIHVHHPDPMAALALYLSGFKGKIILHWHSDIIRQNKLLKLYRPLQSWLIRRADAIVGTSPVYLEQSSALARIQQKCHCIPIGVYETTSNAALTEQIRQQYAGKKIVFSLGRLVLYKGYEHLIQAATYLPDDYVVLIGGTGHQHNHLSEIINSQKLNDKVKLLGFVPDEELGAYFDASDLFCLPSIDKREAFAIVQVKAMIHGRPIVSTDIPGSGVPWVNQNGISGITVPPCDSKALATAIQQVCADEQYYHRLCHQSRQRYEQLFRMEKMIDAHQALYEEILQGKRPNSASISTDKSQFANL